MFSMSSCVRKTECAKLIQNSWREDFRSISGGTGNRVSISFSLVDLYWFNWGEKKEWVVSFKRPEADGERPLSDIVGCHPKEQSLDTCDRVMDLGSVRYRQGLGDCSPGTSGTLGWWWGGGPRINVSRFLCPIWYLGVGEGRPVAQEPTIPQKGCRFNVMLSTMEL